jgi:hypothetical protein
MLSRIAYRWFQFDIRPSLDIPEEALECFNDAGMSLTELEVHETTVQWVGGVVAHGELAAAFAV